MSALYRPGGALHELSHPVFKSRRAYGVTEQEVAG